MAGSCCRPRWERLQTDWSHARRCTSSNEHVLVRISIFSYISVTACMYEVRKPSNLQEACSPPHKQ